MPKCTAPVKGHKSAAARAACPVHGTQAWRVNAPTPPTVTYRARGMGRSTGGVNGLVTAADRSARQTGSVAGADFIAWIVLAAIVSDKSWLLALGAIAVILPIALAVEWTYQCSAWVNDGTARCRRPRAGIFKRCHSHSRAVMTQYDAAAAAALIIAIINALILIAALTAVEA